MTPTLPLLARKPRQLCGGRQTTINLYSVLYPAINGGASTLTRRFKEPISAGGIDDGQAAWRMLEEKPDGITNAGRQASYEMTNS